MCACARVQPRGLLVHLLHGANCTIVKDAAVELALQLYRNHSVLCALRCFPLQVRGMCTRVCVCTVCARVIACARVCMCLCLCMCVCVCVCICVLLTFFVVGILCVPTPVPMRRDPSQKVCSRSLHAPHEFPCSFFSN